MARPRVIRIGENGEITLKNIDPTIADSIKALVTGVEREVEAPAEPDTNALKSTAIGIHENKDGSFGVAVIRYDAVSGVAKVENIETTGKLRSSAITKFKVFAVKNKLV